MSNNGVYQDKSGRLRCDPSRVEPSERVRVAVRVRPIGTNLKIADAGDPCLDTTEHTVRTQVGHPPRWKNYSFDHVFTGGQDEIDRTLGVAILDDVLAGYNVTLFAYGQTGTGKTYSMLGGQTRDTEGIIPRFCRRLFDTTGSRMAADPDLEVSISAEYVEIYNEQIRDLLVPADKQTPLTLIRDRADNKVKVHGVTVCPVRTASEMANLVAYGNVQRQVQETAFNERSSRSHSVLLVRVSQRVLSTGDRVQSEAVLVDLAGSERANPRQPLSQDRFDELRRINKSLHVLGRALKDGGEFSQGMLRESKLTWLLSSSLSGANCRTWMLACMNPTSESRSITNVTLEYAANAMTLLNQAIVNRYEEQRAADAATAKTEARAALQRDRDAARAVRERLGIIGDVPPPGVATISMTEAEVAQLRQMEADLQRRVTELEARLATSEETQTSLRDEIQALLGEFLASARSVDNILGALGPTAAGVPVAEAGEGGDVPTADAAGRSVAVNTTPAATGQSVGVGAEGFGGMAFGEDAFATAAAQTGGGLVHAGTQALAQHVGVGGAAGSGLGLGVGGGHPAVGVGVGGVAPFGAPGAFGAPTFGGACVVHGRGGCPVGMGFAAGCSGGASTVASGGLWGGRPGFPGWGDAFPPSAPPLAIGGLGPLGGLGGLGAMGGMGGMPTLAPSSFQPVFPAPSMMGATAMPSFGGGAAPFGAAPFTTSAPYSHSAAPPLPAVGEGISVAGGRFTVTAANASVSRAPAGAGGGALQMVNYNIYVTPNAAAGSTGFGGLTSGGVGQHVTPNETVKEVAQVATAALPPPDAFLR